MPNYISSNANRFYTALETNYGQAAVVNAENRFPAVKLQVQQVVERGKRLDKTGTRTFLGAPVNGRRHTAFATRTYLTSWGGTLDMGYSPLFQSALGSAPQISSGLPIAEVQNTTRFQTTGPHGFSAGSAVSFFNEIRFVTGTPDSSTMIINAPFTNLPHANEAFSPAITFRLSTALPTVTLYDYWDPVTTTSRVITGAAVDVFQISVNGDYHEFAFSGPAADVVDSSSFVAGEAGLSSFPAEPALSQFDYSIVPGHLGQAWLGSATNQFFTLTEAHVEVKNNINMRNQEYGSSYPRAIVPGPRQVASHFSVFAQNDAQTSALYAAAKRRDRVAAMLQLGQQQGQLMGIFLPNVTPEIPNYDDSETRLQWQFKSNLAQGMADDELYIAFA
jgi:hypothetical protein